MRDFYIATAILLLSATTIVVLASIYGDDSHVADGRCAFSPGFDEDE